MLPSQSARQRSVSIKDQRDDLYYAKRVPYKSTGGTTRRSKGSKLKVESEEENEDDESELSESSDATSRSSSLDTNPEVIQLGDMLRRTRLGHLEAKEKQQKERSRV